MSQEQAERALQRLYEDAGTRDELTDDEADVLLKWGEAQIERLAAANMDDERFEEAFAQLTRLMTRMNRFAARRAGQAPDEQQTALGRIAESAAAVGLQAPAETISAQVAPDTLSNLQALITMLTPASSPIAPAEPHSIQLIGKTPHDEEDQQSNDFI